MKNETGKDFLFVEMYYWTKFVEEIQKRAFKNKKRKETQSLLIVG